MKRLKFVFIGLGILLCIGYLVTSAIQATGVPYKHINELANASADQPTREVKVTGKVVEGELDYDPHAPEIRFKAEGPEGHTIDVYYQGIKPDAMVEGSHVILTGRYHPDEKILKADTLLAKCPSRYKSEYSDKQRPKRPAVTD